MAKDKTNETTEVTTSGTATYKVTYTYAAPNGQLRSSSIIIDALTEGEAKRFAADLIKGQKHAKVGKVTLY